MKYRFLTAMLIATFCVAPYSVSIAAGTATTLYEYHSCTFMSGKTDITGTDCTADAPAFFQDMGTCNNPSGSDTAANLKKANTRVCNQITSATGLKTGLTIPPQDGNNYVTKCSGPDSVPTIICTYSSAKPAS